MAAVTICSDIGAQKNLKTFKIFLGYLDEGILLPDHYTITTENFFFPFHGNIYSTQTNKSTTHIYIRK